MAFGGINHYRKKPFWDVVLRIGPGVLDMLVKHSATLKIFMFGDRGLVYLLRLALGL